jgi:hypothetical protein
VAKVNHYAEVKARLSVSAVVALLGIPFKGKDFRCPKCQGDNKARSNDDRGWCCVKCDGKGDGIDLFQMVKLVSPEQALAMAAVAVGYEVDGGNNPAVPMSRFPAPAILLEIPKEVLLERHRALTVAMQHYDSLRRSPEEYLTWLGFRYDYAVINAVDLGRRYLVSRGINPDKTYSTKIGIAPSWASGLIERLEKEGGSTLVEHGIGAGLLVKRKSDGGLFEWMRGRVLFPWCNPGIMGETVYIKGRKIHDLEIPCRTADAPNYMGLRTSGSDGRMPHVTKPVVPYGEPWFGENLAKGVDGPVLVLESEIDAFSANLCGIPAIAIGGGGGGVSTDDLKRFLSGKFLDETGRRVLVMFDNDWRKMGPELREGKPLTIDIVTAAARGLAKDIKALWTLHPVAVEKDINDTLRVHGPDRVAEVYQAATAAALRPNEPRPAALDAPPDPPPPTPTEPPPPSKDHPTATILPPSESPVAAVPPGWEVRDGQLFVVALTKGGQEEVATFTGVRCAPKITAILQDTTTGAYHVEIASEVVGTDHYVKTVVTAATVANSTTIVSMADRGFNVTSRTAKAYSAYLDDYRHFNAGKIPFAYGATQMGWHGDARDGLTFLMGTESRGAKELRYIGEDDTVTKALTLRGSMERWQKGVLHVLSGIPEGLVMLYGALAASSVRFIDSLSGFCIEISGPSRSGKSTLMEAAASAVGDPASGMIRSGGNQDTINGMEVNAALFNDLPGFYEDTHLLPDDIQAKLPMMLANGEGKGRSNRTGTGREPIKRWNTVSLLDGESSTTSTTTNAGTGARVLHLDPPTTLDLEQISKLKTTAARNHGHAIRAWVDHLRDPGSVMKLTQAYHGWLTKCRALGCPTENIHQSWAECWALIVTVAEASGPVIGAEEGDVDTLMAFIGEWFRENAPPDQPRSALEIALTWASSRVSEVTRDSDGGFKDGQHEVWIRIHEDGDVTFAKTTLQQRLKREGIALATVLESWSRRRWLRIREQGNERVTHTWPVRIGTGSVRAITISAEAIALAGLGDFTRTGTQRTLDVPGSESRYN